MRQLWATFGDGEVARQYKTRQVYSLDLVGSNYVQSVVKPTPQRAQIARRSLVLSTVVFVSCPQSPCGTYMHQVPVLGTGTNTGMHQVPAPGTCAMPWMSYHNKKAELICLKLWRLCRWLLRLHQGYRKREVPSKNAPSTGTF